MLSPKSKQMVRFLSSDLNFGDNQIGNNVISYNQFRQQLRYRKKNNSSNIFEHISMKKRKNSQMGMNKRRYITSMERPGSLSGLSTF